MKGVFVTGMDTGAGKTIVCGLLGRYLLYRGYQAITQKWIQTGTKYFPSDIDMHLRLMKRKREAIKSLLCFVSPYSFRFPASAHLATRLERRKISAMRIKKAFRELLKRFDFVIVEGIGGALVPYNKKRLVIDIAKELNLPVLVVSQNRLGAINHTLLTIEALRARGMKILGIIFNSQHKKENKIILKDNPRIIKALTKVRILGSLPWIKNKDMLYKAFLPIGDRIFTQLAKM